MTVCDRGEGGSKIIKKSVTYFMDGPLAHSELTRFLPYYLVPGLVCLSNSFSLLT